jgi:hypothetical protein
MKSLNERFMLSLSLLLQKVHYTPLLRKALGLDLRMFIKNRIVSLSLACDHLLM